MDIKDIKPGDRITIPNVSWYKEQYEYGIIDSIGLKINWYGKEFRGWDYVKTVFENWGDDIKIIEPPKPIPKQIISRINSIEI